MAFKLEVLGMEFGAAEARDIGAKLAQAAPVSVGILVECGKGAGGGSVLEGEPALESIGGEVGERLLSVGGICLEALEELESVLTCLPFAESALTPFREVLFGDGAAVEVVFEGSLDLRQSIEPEEDGVGGLMIAKAAVELLADRVWEESDFSVTHRR